MKWIHSFFLKFSAERVDLNKNFISPFYYQQLKMYQYASNISVNNDVLDAGCGSGYGADLISRKAKMITAIDIDCDSIRIAQQNFINTNLKFICSSIENFNSTKRYDLILSFQVIEHIKPANVNTYLKNLKKLLEQDGTLIISTPNSPNSSFNENPYHFHEYTFSELSDLLHKYFHEVKLHSVIGSSRVNKFEQKRKQNSMRLFNKDPLKIRRLMPRKFKQILFDIFSYRGRQTIDKNSNKINSKDFIIVKNQDKSALDIIAICSNARG